MFFVYILLCSDNSYYVGLTSDLDARVNVHNAGSGATHTRARLPVRLVYSEHHEKEATAVRRERQIKGWSRAKKEALIREDLALLRALSRRRS